MPRELIPFTTDDVSAFAKALRAQLTARAATPTHVQMLNMLARAAGYRNFQHLRACPGRRAAVDTRGPTIEQRWDSALVLRAAGFFDDLGRLKSWPSRTAVQHLCMWVVWSKIPLDRVFSERDMSRLLGALHLFADHAIIRRTLCEMGLLTRTRDGREYRRVKQAATPEAAALIRRVREQQR